MKFFPQLRIAAVGVGCLAYLRLSAEVGAQSWTGATSGQWSDPSNWASATVPNSTFANVDFPDVSRQDVDLGSGTYFLQRLSFSAADTYTVSGGTLRCWFNSGSQPCLITQNGAGSVIINANLLLDRDTAFQGNGPGAVTVNGNISGTGRLIVEGTGYTLTLAGNNSFSQGIFIGSGAVLEVGRTQSLGNAGPMTVLGGGTLRATGNIMVDKFVTFQSGASVIDTGAFDVTFARGIARSGLVSVLTKLGTGRIVLTSMNSFFSGDLDLKAGSVVLAAANALGGGNEFGGGAIAIASEASLDVNGYYAAAHTLSGTGEVKLGNGGVLYLGLGASTFGGVISGAGRLSHSNISSASNGGTLTLTGSNTFTGGTFVSTGTIVLGADNALASTGAITVSGDGTFDVNSHRQTAGAVTLEGGAISGTTGALTASSYLVKNGTISAVLSGAGALSKVALTPPGYYFGYADGTVTLTGANTYSGGTTVEGGTLRVNNASGSGTGSGVVVVNRNGTLAGSGAIAGAVIVNAGGTLAPGDNIGMLSTGDLSLTSGATVLLELDSATAGTGYDQVNVSGSVSLGNATLQLLPSSAAGTLEGANFFVIVNDGLDAVSGVFNGYDQDAFYTVSNNQLFQISYTGDWATDTFEGTGNDVVLRAIVPEPSSRVLGLGALGVSIACLAARSRRRRVSLASR